ncbi:MAG: protease SohB [Gammaproteobacteria bacterium]|nr:protease SohB [Gammaproteobacteria bacterium]
MVDVLLQYGLFLAKSVTIVVALGILIATILSLTHKAKHEDKLEVKNLNEKFRHMALAMKGSIFSKKEFKKELKAEKLRRKEEKKKTSSTVDGQKKRVFVINFHGDIKATAVASLREEITAILAIATPEDEVLLRLENAGGLVHEHGLAASQLQRIRARGIALTIAVDKVAASGGYMMACVGNRVVAAPFAVLGSIGVLAQLPNFNRLLKQKGIDFELIKAGELKRTLTLFGENTDQDRARFKEQIEDTHSLFKDFVAENRPGLDINQVANGDHWFGKRALELKLVDELQTSDDYLLLASKEADLYEINYSAGKTISEKLASVIGQSADRLFFSWWQRNREQRFFT